jgi:NAD(P)H-dependent FMN reductase
MPKLMIIVASTREGRAGLPLADWFIERAREHGAFEVETVDLAELELPIFDEPKHPRLREYVHDHTRRWSEMVDACDAFVFVTPEYNHGYPASLKNAIDYLHHEWQWKPLGFVSYGGVSAGTRAVQQLKLVALGVRLVPLFEAVNVPFFQQFIEDGTVRANEVMEQAAQTMLDELARVQYALRPLRSDVAQRA